VRNVGAVTTRKDLERLFNTVGKVVLVDVLNNANGTIVVEMETPEAAKKAIRKFNRMEHDGQILSVEPTSAAILK